MSPTAITGMHRTGTSMVAKSLLLAGLHLGDDADMVDAAPDNPEGFFEHAGFVRLNDDLLEATGGAWDHPPTCGPMAVDDPRVTRLAATAHELVEALSVVTPWGWKDPRTCLTAPFWLDVVADLRFLVCVRHPFEVALSLKRRNRSSYALGLSLWQRYYETLLDVVPEERRLLTHYDAHFEEGAAELDRVGRFAGIADDAIAATHTARDERLRHHRLEVTLPELGASPALVDLYRRLCEESGRIPEPDGIAVAPWINRAALDLVAANEQLDRHGRHVATLERRHEELTEQVTALEAGARHAADLASVNHRLDSLERALHDLRYADERLETRHDGEVVRNCRALVREHVPASCRVLVVAKGDGAILDLYGRAASDFPQDASGRYLGFSFGDSVAATAHLEALRCRGHDFLLVPETARWWFEHYPAFTDHLLGRYDATAVPGAGVLVDLRTRRGNADGSPRAITETVEAIAAAEGHSPALLDWSGAGAAQLLPAHTVFEPPDDVESLPYLDASVDVVAVTDPERLDEARRVAARAVLVLGTDADGRVVVEALESTVAEPARAAAPRVCVIVPTDDPDPSWLARLREAVAEEEATHVVVTRDPDGIVACARDVDVLTFVESGVVPLPGWLASAHAVLSGERVGAVAVKLLGCDGAVEAAGATVFADGASSGVAAGSHEIDAPWHDYVRETCWGPGVLVVDATLVDKLEGALETPPGVLHATWSARLWEAGFRVLYQPDAVAVRAGPAPIATESGLAAIEAAWATALPARPHRPPVLDDLAWRSVLAHDDVEAAWR